MQTLICQFCEQFICVWRIDPINQVCGRIFLPDDWSQIKRFVLVKDSGGLQGFPDAVHVFNFE